LNQHPRLLPFQSLNGGSLADRLTNGSAYRIGEASARGNSHSSVESPSLLAVVLLVAALFPIAGSRSGSEAAGAQLHYIAVKAASQLPPQLGSNEWLLTEQNVSFSAQVSQVGSTPTPEAQATVSATIQEWSNNDGESCTSATTSPAEFVSPVNKAAWHSAGLLDSPTTQPVASCSTVTNGFGQGIGPIDVSGLPTDPSVLAQELTTGTTGISGLDQVSSHDENAGFARAAIILVGPTEGTTPAFNAALFNALAMLPGIDSLGQMTARSGVSGLGFASNSTVGQSVIIVNPTSGALIEARNLQDQAAFSGLESAYVAAPMTQGGYSTRVLIRWFDPIGSPVVVGADSLPRSVSLLPEVPDTGSIAATARADVSDAQFMTLEDALQMRYGAPASESYVSQALQTATSVRWSFTGPTSQVSAYATALRASSLFSSVIVQYGDAAS
jgi:hypothetical protein